MHELCSSAYWGIKAVNVSSSPLLLSLINSSGWLDGSPHSVLGGQSSSPYQLALATLPKMDGNTMHACVYWPAHTLTQPHLPHRTRQDSNRWEGRGIGPPATILQPLDWIRSPKIYGWQALSTFLCIPSLSFSHSPFAHSRTVCWSCWHKLKNVVVVFRFLAHLCCCPD